MNEIITLTHQKGGVLKTTVAHHLAHGLVKQGQEVILVDMDTQQTLSIINTIREQSGLVPLTIYTPQSISELMDIFENNQDKILICDNAGMDSDMNRYSIEVATKIIVPLMASINDILGLEKFYSILDEIHDGIKINVLLVKVHSARKNFKMVEDLLKDSENSTLLETKILDKKENYSTMESGRSVYDIEHTLSSRYDELIEELEL